MARAVASNRTLMSLKNAEANSATSGSQAFKQACEKAKIKPSTRQARKFRSGRGLAFLAKDAAVDFKANSVAAGEIVDAILGGANVEVKTATLEATEAK